jgi:hypothetical protein
MKKLILMFAALFSLSGAAWGQTTYTLAQSKQLALQNNSRTRNGTLEIQGAEAQQRQARVKYYPNVSALGVGVYSPKNLVDINTPATSFPVTGGMGGNVDIAPFQYAGLKGFGTASVTALEPLYAGGQIRTGNKLADLQVDVTRDQLLVAQREVALSTEERYYQVVALTAKLGTLDATEKQLNGIYKQVNDSYQAGLAVHNDVMKVQLQRNPQWASTGYPQLLPVRGRPLRFHPSVPRCAAGRARSARSVQSSRRSRENPARVSAFATQPYGRRTANQAVAGPVPAAGVGGRNGLCHQVSGLRCEQQRYVSGYGIGADFGAIRGEARA